MKLLVCFLFLSFPLFCVSEKYTQLSEAIEQNNVEKVERALFNYYLSSLASSLAFNSLETQTQSNAAELTKLVSLAQDKAAECRVKSFIGRVISSLPTFIGHGALLALNAALVYFEWQSIHGVENPAITMFGKKITLSWSPAQAQFFMLFNSFGTLLFSYKIIQDCYRITQNIPFENAQKIVSFLEKAQKELTTE